MRAHKPDCPKLWDAYESGDNPWIDYPGEPRDEPKPVPERIDIAGWEFLDRILTVAGREWPTIRSRSNIGPFLNCWKFIVRVPLILWPGDGEVEIDFCFRCAAELGVLESLRRPEE